MKKITNAHIKIQNHAKKKIDLLQITQEIVTIYVIVPQYKQQHSLENSVAHHSHSLANVRKLSEWLLKEHKNVYIS